jgi:hypothetical protein
MACQITHPTGKPGGLSLAVLRLDAEPVAYLTPQTGQFLSVDPQVQQTLEAYEYVDDDPVNGIDPEGTCNSGSQGYAQCGDPDIVGYSVWRICERENKAGIVGHGRDLFSWVHHHWRGIVTVVGITLGAAAVVTGFGALVGGSVVLGFVSGGIGIASGLADLPACIGTRGHHNGAACTGAIAGVFAGGVGASGAFVEFGSAALESTSIVRSAVAGLLAAKAFSVGSASTVWDFVNALIRKSRVRRR